MIIVSIITTWLAGVILGFALIYFGAMGAGAISVQAGAPQGFWAALYMSIGQFSTVGVENMAAVHPVVDFLTVLQALSSVVLLSMIISFLVNVYNGIQMLRSLCADVSLSAGVDQPLAVLYPFFPAGQPIDLERYLTNTWGDLNLYGDVLRQTRTTYYFQSGDDEFAAPFALSSISGIVAALRWGIPVGASPVSTLPGLLRMEESLAAARSWISDEILRLPAAPAPDPVSRSDFAAQLAALRSDDAAAGAGVVLDPGVEEFDRMCRDVARLLSPDDAATLALAADPDEAYDRYAAWLRFAAVSHRFNTALSADLDYQPLYTGATPLPFDAGGVARALPPDSVPAARRGWVRGWLGRRRVFVDPGGFRVRSGLLALGTSVLAVGLTMLVGALLGFDSTPVTALAAVVALFGAPASAPGRGNAGRWSGLGAFLPVGLAIAAAAVTPRDADWSVLAVAVAAFATTIAAAAGARWAAYGQLAFVTYFIGLLLGVTSDALVPALIAGAFGVLAALAAHLVPSVATRTRLLGAGVDGVVARVDALLDVLEDAVNTGLGDARQRRKAERAVRALAAAVAALGGRASQSVAEGRAADLSVAESDRLWIALLDVQSAADDLVRRVFGPNSTAHTALGSGPGETIGVLTLSDRAIVADRFDRVRTAPDDSSAPAAPPSAAAVRSLADSADRLGGAIAGLRGLAKADGSPATVAGAGSRLPSTADVLQPAAVSGRPAGTDASRRAVQSAIATAGALLLAGFVSTSHQLWAAMPALQLVQGAGKQTRGRSIAAIVATVAGATAGFTASLLLAHDPRRVVILLGVCIFCFGFTRSVGARWSVFWLNAGLALVYDAWSTMAVEWVPVRIAETAIGAVVAALVAAFILPVRAWAHERATLRAAVGAITEVVRAAVAGTADATASVPAMMQAVTGYEDAVDPLRRDAGSMHARGVESRLGALRALASDAARLAGEPGGGAPVALQALGRSTLINLDALADACAGRAPRHVVAGSALDAAATEAAGQPAVAAARAVTADALALIEAVRPGSI